MNIGSRPTPTDGGTDPVFDPTSLLGDADDRLAADTEAGGVGVASLIAAPLVAGAQVPSGVRLRTIKTNGINLRVAEMGRGPLVILVHGWPESWYSWRHQIPALAAAGYQAMLLHPEPLAKRQNPDIPPRRPEGGLRRRQG